jgi:Transglutaminase-like superfamily/Coenzyme PQQ synthesis protein D (PqqD)
MSEESTSGTCETLSTIAPNVFWVDSGGGTIVLNMETGRYFAFDSVAAFIWKLLGNASPLEEIATAVASDYGLNVDVARADVDSFVQKLRESKLVETSAHQGGRQPPSGANVPNSSLPVVTTHIPSAEDRKVSALSRCVLFFEAYGLMVCTDVALRVVGFHGLWRRLGGIKHAVVELRGDSDHVKTLSGIALTAFRWYRPGAACKQRAMTTFWFLRRHGIPVTLCLGVRDHPFGSHVWSELEGAVVNDYRAVRERFKTIARLA